jgi:hypothetical protein
MRVESVEITTRSLLSVFLIWELVLLLNNWMVNNKTGGSNGQTDTLMNGFKLVLG